MFVFNASFLRIVFCLHLFYFFSVSLANVLLHFFNTPLNLTNYLFVWMWSVFLHAFIEHFRAEKMIKKMRVKQIIFDPDWSLQTMQIWPSSVWHDRVKCLCNGVQLFRKWRKSDLLCFGSPDSHCQVCGVSSHVLCCLPSCIIISHWLLTWTWTFTLCCLCSH